MKRRWLTVVLSLLAVAGLFLSTGCAGNWGDSTALDRARVVDRDIFQLREQTIWLLGLDEPSGLHEDTFPPY